MKTQSLIVALAHEMKRRHPRRHDARRCHYERRQPIDLRYDAEFHGTGPAGSGTDQPIPATFSLAASADPAPLGAPFADSSPGVVESFEEEAELEEVPAWGTGELDEDQDEGPRYTLARSEATEEAVPIWGTAELETAFDPAPSDEPAPVLAASARTVAPGPRALPNAAPDDDLDTAAFQADLAAILGGKKSHPSTATPGAASDDGAGEDGDPSPPPPAPASQPQAQGFSHDVFERMGHPLSTAQTFDLGSFSLQRQLDAFDRELDRADLTAARRRRPAASSPTPPVPPPAPRPVARAATPAIDIRHEVPLIPQLTGMSCWAAGCAMIVGWRDSMSVDPSEIARATGAWAQYHAGLEPENVSIFPIWGLEPEAPQSYSVEAFLSLLQRYGPLWVASAEPGAHIRVVTGAVGDGTPDGTTLLINDPWEQGMATFRMPNAGSRTTETYAQFVRKQESLARAEAHLQGIYVARNARPRN